MPIRFRSRHLVPALLLAISACSDSTHPAPPPGSPARATAVAGDAQTGTPGQALPGALAVLVADSAGRPVPGVSVAWSVEDYGGSVAAASSVTGADGRATASWTLGSYIGAWTARASVGDLVPIVFHATADGPIHVSITSPTPGAVVADSFQYVTTQVTSTAGIAEVKAGTGTTEASLSSRGNAPGEWSGVLPVRGTAGPQRIAVVARDSAGHQALALVNVIHDQPMRIRILDPLSGPLAGHGVVRAQCVDDTPGSCRSFEAFTRSGGVETRIAQGTDSILAEYSTAGLAAPVKIVFRATDAAGVVTTVETADFTVMAGPWTQVVSVDGILLDASLAWALYVAEPMSSYNHLYLHDARARTDESVAQETNIGPGLPGFVTPVGAIINFGQPSNNLKPEGIREWGGSNARAGSGFSPQAAGRWAAFQEYGRVFRDDVLAPSLVGTPASLYVDGGSYLADDGTVALGAWPIGTTGCCLQLYRWNGGAPTQLTSDTFNAVGPVTDGSAFVYQQQLRTGTPRMLRLVYHGAGGGEEVLTPFFHHDLFVGSWSAAVAGQTYQIRNGWVAFEYPDGADTYHTYVRTPSGGVHAVWPGAPAGARLVTVGPQGEVVMIAGGTLYLVDAPHATGTSIGSLSPIRHVKWIDGKLYIVTGGGLYRFDG